MVEVVAFPSVTPLGHTYSGRTCDCLRQSITGASSHGVPLNQVLGVSVNWEAVGAVAEFAAAISVLATLIYLARQIRQGNRQQKLESSRALSSAFNSLNDIFYDAVKTGMIARAADDWKNATVEEQLVAGNYLMQYCQLVQSLHEMWVEEALAENMYETEETNLLSALSTRGASVWWRDAQAGYNVAFVNRLNSLLETNSYSGWDEVFPILNASKWPRDT